MHGFMTIVVAAASLGSVIPCFAQSNEPVTAAASSSATGTGACRLLTDTDVRAIFPDARGGERKRSVEQDGAVGCEWRNAKGLVVLNLIEYQGAPRSVEREAHGFGNVLVDPAKDAAHHAVRYETVHQVGDEAIAVVERADESRGVLGNMAFVVAQQGKRLLLLSSAELAGRDRSAALKALEKLGRLAMERH